MSTREQQRQARRRNQQRRLSNLERKNQLRPEAERLMRERRGMSKTDAYNLAGMVTDSRTANQAEAQQLMDSARARGTSLLTSEAGREPRRMSEIVPRVRSAEELSNRYQAYKDPETGKMRYEYYNIIDATGEGVWQEIDEATYNAAVAEAQRVIDQDYDLR